MGLALATSLLGADVMRGSHASRGTRRSVAPKLSALPAILSFELRAGAFAGSGHADVAVHVPPAFDADRRPGAVVYFHGWRGCVETALAGDDAPCSAGGPARTASDLAAQLDAARVNALLVAVEVRADRATGEPGRLAMPAGLRALLRELFDEHLAAVLGRALDVDGLDRVVLVAHSGGYQALATALALGDVPRVTEVALFDALYGGEDVFRRWVVDEAPRFDSRASDPLRFVDLYTCCGGTFDASVALERDLRGELGARGLGGSFARAGCGPGGRPSLTQPVVMAQVPEEHGALPRAYFRDIAAAAGFASLAAD